jgi:protein-S-isoprenylcysteine O-methyltransferase Ste14
VVRVSSAAIGSTLFFVIAPGTVAALVPWLITHWRLEPAFFGLEALRYVGVALIVLGLVPLIESFARFAAHAGTPAPVAPTAKLVVTGFYRHVRNPMYVGLFAILVGQALMFSSVALLVYAACVAAVVHAFVRLYEEPTLSKTYCEEYSAYCANVARWIPRLSPWRRR